MAAENMRGKLHLSPVVARRDPLLIQLPSQLVLKQKEI